MMLGQERGLNCDLMVPDPSDFDGIWDYVVASQGSIPGIGVGN